MKSDKKIWILFSVAWIAAILNGYFFNWINDSFFHFKPDGNGLREFNLPVRFLVIVILAPLAETLLLQYVPNVLLTRLKVRNRAVLVLVPAFLFGCLHFYFWVYAVMAFVGGMIMNSLYVYAKEHSRHFFLVACLFHALYNLYGFLFVV